MSNLNQGEDTGGMNNLFQVLVSFLYLSIYTIMYDLSVYHQGVVWNCFCIT